MKTDWPIDTFHAVWNVKQPQSGLKLIQGSLKHVKAARKHSDIAKRKDTNICKSKDPPRNFDCDVRNTSYAEGHTLDVMESGSKGMIRPVRECKYFVGAVVHSEQTGGKEYIVKFLSEALRFTCACLNARTNGIIYFGVADENETNAGEVGCDPREVVGVPVTTTDEIIEYKTMLNEFVGLCFSKDTRDEARYCIKPAEFVPVRPNGASNDTRDHYVIEIDIEASHKLSCGKLFKVKLPSTIEYPLTGPRKVEYCQYKCFLRVGEESRELDAREINEQYEKIKMLDNERESAEQKTAQNMRSNVANTSSPDMTRKLKSLLGFHRGKLDESFYRLLVVSKLTPAIKEKGIQENFSFLGNMPWDMIIDFNGDEKSEDSIFQIIASESAYSVHEAEDYEDDAKLLEGLLEERTWIFANGWDTAETVAMDDKTWRTSSRLTGLDNVSKYLGKTVLPNRILVTFLIYGEHFEQQVITLEGFCRHFTENQMMYMVEDQQVATQWLRTITQRCMSQHVAMQRSITGIQWKDIQETFIQCIKGYSSEKLYLPKASGTLIEVPSKSLNTNIISVPSIRECNALVDLDPSQFREMSKECEQNYYKGNTVTWTNLWFTNKGEKHVIKRDCQDEVYDKVCAALNNHNKNVSVVKLLYQRGTGGTTVAMQTLWKLLKSKPPFQCRVCIVLKACDRAIDEILRVYDKGYHLEEYKLPVVVLADGIVDILFTDIMVKLTNKISERDIQCGPVVVFLRTSHMTHSHRINTYDISEDSIYLPYLLSNNEYQDFATKYNDMKLTYGLKEEDFEMYAAHSMIAFMILLKQDKESRKEYITFLVNDTFAGGITDEEETLLTYLSLLNIYNPYQVYLSAFDVIMTSVEFLNYRLTWNWKNDISDNVEKFLREFDSNEQYGSGRAVAIIHPDVAAHILQYQAKHQKKSVGDIVLDFLGSPLFVKTANVTQTLKHLHEATKIVLRKRRKTQESNYERDTKFSPLMEKILCPGGESTDKASEANLQKAIKILNVALDKFGEPIFAQHIARMCYLCAFNYGNKEHYFKKAKEYGLKAHRKSHTNSAFLDTLGRVNQGIFKAKYKTILRTAEHISHDQIAESIDIACEAVGWFQKSQYQDMANTGGRKHIHSCYGELAVVFELLNLLGLYVSAKELKRYLTDTNFVPEGLTGISGDHHAIVKTFRNRYYTCMKEIEEDRSIFKEGITKSESQDIFSLQKQATDYKASFVIYFLPEKLEVGDLSALDLDGRLKCRWNQIDAYLLGYEFNGPFNLDRPYRKSNSMEPRNILLFIKGLLEDNMNENEYQKSGRDLLCYITVSLALHSPFGGVSYRLPRQLALDELERIRVFVHWIVNNCDKRDRQRLYGYLFEVMLTWPHEEQCMVTHDFTLEKLWTALNKLKERCNPLRHRVDDEVEEKIFRQTRFKGKRGNVTTLFFLGKGFGLDAFVHRNEIQELSSTGKRSVNLQSKEISKRLKTLIGVRISRSEIQYKNSHTRNQTITINMDIKEVSEMQTFTKGKVSFYLGFSWGGLLAFNVQVAGKHEVYRELPHPEEYCAQDDHQEHYVYPDLKKKIKSRKKHLKEIEELEKQSMKGRTLDENQVST